MIWAIVLAAGESKRMGGPKLLLPYGKVTVLETVLQNVFASRVNGIMVVLGSRWRKIKNVIKNYNVQTVINRLYTQGMLSSVQRGISALSFSCKAAVVVLADQPDIPPKVINTLISAYLLKKKGLIVPVYRGTRGHPLLVDLKYRQEIMLLDAARGLRQLLEDHPQDILEVQVSTLSILRDIDDPMDYQEAQDSKASKSLSNASMMPPRKIGLKLSKKKKIV